MVLLRLLAVELGASPPNDESHKSISCIQFGKKCVLCTFGFGSLKMTESFFLLWAPQHWMQMLLLSPSYHRGLPLGRWTCRKSPEEILRARVSWQPFFHPDKLWNVLLLLSYWWVSSSNCLWLFKQLLWNQNWRPSTDEWIVKMWYLHTMGL